MAAALGHGRLIAAMGMDAAELQKLLKEAGYEVESDDSPETPSWVNAGGGGFGEDESEPDERPGDIPSQALLRKQLEREMAGDDTPRTNAAIYFRDIADLTLLTAEEEIDLAQRIESGCDARRIMERHPGLTHDKREQLQDEVERGEAARRRLTESNLRLVVSVARKYLNRGLPMLDLIQEGNIGLARAVEKYEWRKGYRFSTYAYWWIRQGMTRAIAEQARTIRVPVHMVGAIGDVFKANRDLQQKLGREPQLREVAGELGLTLHKVQEITQAARQPISLETPLGEDGGATVGDLIADSSGGGPHELAANSLLRRHMQDALEVLSPREREVVRLRYGLDDGRDHTLTEIADVLGVSSERIRQIESAALTKLRQPKLRHKLREYLDEYVA